MTFQHKLIIAFNILAGMFFSIVMPHQDGGQFLGCILLVFFHILLVYGFSRRKNWARWAMLVYSGFQIAAITTAALVAVLISQFKPIGTWSLSILILSISFLPFLGWICFTLRPSNENF